jgi:hypothetical protein
VVVDALKTGIVGLENLVPDQQTALVTVGLWFHPRDEHPRPVVGPAADIEPPLASRVPLHFHFVDPVRRGLIRFRGQFPSLLLEGGGQPVSLHQLVEAARVARLDVRVPDGDE